MITFRHSKQPSAEVKRGDGCLQKHGTGSKFGFYLTAISSEENVLERYTLQGKKIDLSDFYHSFDAKTQPTLSFDGFCSLE